MTLPFSKIYLYPTLPASEGYTFQPQSINDFSFPGFSGPWAVATDFNLDGILDVVVGAPGNDDKDVDAGRVFVSFSNVGGALGDGTAERIIDGVSAGDMSGASVAILPDVNGGGSAPEIIIGSPGLDLNGSDAGGAYVVFGTTMPGGFDLNDIQNGDGGGFLIKGAAAGDFAGTIVASVSDQNGDGKADILVAATGNDVGGQDAGAAYIVWGKSTISNVDLGALGAGSKGVSIIGENAGDQAGSSLASIADMNGDGRSEILVGAVGNDETAADGGAIYVVFGGKPASGTINLDNVAAGIGGYKIVGSVGGLGLGTSVASVGDIDGDGLADIVAGAASGSTAYVIYGKSNGATISTDSLEAGIGGFAITAEPGQSLVGMTVTGGEDLNGDGRADFVIGVPYDTEGGMDAGAVYIVWGGQGTVDLGNVANGIGGAKIIGQAGSLTGSSVEIVADANEDGKPDLLIGSSGTGGEQVTLLYSPAEWMPGPEVYGTSGNDVIDSGYGSPHMVGEDQDVIFGFGGDDVINAHGGDDVIDGGDGNDLIDGGAGNDTIFSGIGLNTVHGGTGDDTIDSTAGVDIVHGDEGNDTITLGDLGGSAFGDNGADVLTGGAASDVLDGGDGNDILSGNGGDDLISGGAGNDVIDGGKGADTMDGGEGDDTYYVDDLNDVVTDSGGHDTVVIDATLLDAGWTAPTGIETLVVLGTQSVHLQGDSGNNNLVGGNGNDVIDGGVGDDIEIGGEGNDRLISSAGHDNLIGGAGDDAYVISGGSARIEDFQGNDTVDASASTTDDVIDLEDGHHSTIQGQDVELGVGGSITQSLDVQFLQDLTGSFADDISNVQSLIPQIVDSLKAVQADAQFGVSTFRDKPMGNFGNVGDWVFATADTISADSASLIDAYSTMVADGGNDEPEAQLEALMQLALNANSEGFRTGTARIAVMFTDATFHVAGEGLAAGIANPNNGDNIVDGGGIGEDYPMISQVRSALESAGIIPVFAVTPGLETLYADLVTALGRGQVVTLTTDSSNVVSAITTGLTAATTTSIENALGGEGNDHITGNLASNRLDGGDGNDVIAGLGGNDTLIGGNGSDRIDGGDGIDTAVFAGNRDRYTINTGADGRTTVHDTVTGSDDFLTNVENAAFDDMTLALSTTGVGGSGVTITGTDIVACEEDGPGLSISALGHATTDSGASLSVDLASLDTLPAGVTYDEASASFSFDPTDPVYNVLGRNDTMTLVVNYVVTDGTSSAPTSLTISVAGTNDGPVVTGAVTAAIDAGSGSIALDPLASSHDPDAGDVLSVVVDPATLPAGVSFDGSSFHVDPSDPAYTSIPAGENVTITLDYMVSDGLVETPATASIVIAGTHIDAPILTVSGPLTVDLVEDGAAIGIDALANATDSDTSLALSIVVDESSLPAGVSFDPATHVFSIDPSNSAYQSLAEGDTASVTVNYAISDGFSTVAATAQIAIHGANDVALIGGSLSGAVEEDTILTSSGDLVVNDPDAGQSGFVATTVSGTYGTVTVEKSGHWTYSLDNTLASVQSLAHGEAVDDVLTVHSIDGTEATLTINVIGRMDAPAGLNAVSGTDGPDILAGTDGADFIVGLNGNDIISAGAGNDFIDGGLGRDFVDAGAGDDTILVGGGTNDYRLSSDPVDGGTGYDSVVFDGNAADFRVTTIAGTATTDVWNVTTGQRFTLANVEKLVFFDQAIQLKSDTLTISAPGIAASGIEDGIPVALDALQGAVSPYGDVLKAVVDASALPDGVTFDAASQSFILDPAAAVFQSLAAGAVKSVAVSYQITDGNRSTDTAATFTVTGVNDAAQIGGLATGEVTEDGSVQTAGSLTVSDPDAGEAAFLAGAIEGTFGTLTLAADGTWSYALANSRADIQALNEGDTRTDRISVHTLDGTTEDIVITIHGSNEAIITGTAGNDTLTGTSGNDVMDGLAGRDRMAGGLGDDTYYVDNSRDTAIENTGEGHDRVISTVTYTLAANVEDLSLAGGAAINGTGNALANVLTGNDSANVLSGNDGNDQLYGGAGNDMLLGGNGNDLLDGGTGADSMNGGAGDDTFIVDNAGDIVTGGNGTDTALASISSLTMASGLEIAFYTGAGNSMITGNGSANQIHGGAGADQLFGGGGADFLYGGAGADVLTGGAGNDTFVFKAGETRGDMVMDFTGAGSKIGDVLRFEDFGSGSIAATGVAGHYLVTADAAHGGASEEFVLNGVTNLNLNAGSNDYMFV